MKCRLILLFCLLGALRSTAETDSLTAARIRTEILLRGECYNNLRTLTKTIGHRLSGSPEAARAVAWGLKSMKDAGADTAWLQPVWVPHWVRGKESLRVNGHPVKMLSLGNAAGSDGKTLKAQIVMVQTLDEFKALTRKEVEGRIVFFNYHFRQDFVSPFEAYGDAIKYRAFPPALVAQKGGAAVIIRSLSSGLDDAPHTGMTRYTDTIRKIPAVSIGNTTADTLELLCRNGAVTAELMTSAKMMDSVLSYNVIGEYRGREIPREYVVCGGHLDSWDVGEGAQDDGAGCVQAIEVIRTFHALSLRPARTVRAVLFMNEENGARGGRAYADSARSKAETHILALESDAGGFSPRGIGLEMPEAKKAVIRGYAPIMGELGIYDFHLEEGGTDIDPLKKQLNVPLAGLIPDPQRYFDYHHTERDVFEVVNHRELKLGAAAMATLVYLIAEHGL